MLVIFFLRFYQPHLSCWTIQIDKNKQDRTINSKFWSKTTGLQTLS